MNKVYWESMRKIWVKGEVYPIAACIATGISIAVYRLGLATKPQEVQITARQEESHLLESVING